MVPGVQTNRLELEVQLGPVFLHPATITQPPQPPQPQRQKCQKQSLSSPDLRSSSSINISLEAVSEMASESLRNIEIFRNAGVARVSRWCLVAPW